MTWKTALLASAALLLPGLAQAQPVSGLYLGLGAGVNWLMNSDIRASVPGLANGNGTARFDPDFAGVASLGWGFGNGLRTEVEVNYRLNEVDRVSGFGRANDAVNSIGRTRNWVVMANALYDFDLGPGFPVVPYLGAGVGALRVNWDNVQQRSNVGTDIVQVVGGEWTFAYQAIVGAALPVTPNLALTAEYRFLGALDSDSRAFRWTAAGRTQGTAEVETMNHSVMLGLRYAFAAPPPPPVVAPAPAPAAAPAPARTFLVFFDFDRADLTDRARQIIAEAATNAQRVGSTRIEVAGHADRAGNPQYNQRLSERRAQAVAAELERRGVPRTAMVIQAFGETRPLVPTADGVREPQNRRVEIVLR